MDMNNTIALAERLAGITIGNTARVAGVSVTRWGADAFELNTWGTQPCVTGAQAIGAIAAQNAGESLPHTGGHANGSSRADKSE